MHPETRHILLVENNPDDVEAVCRTLDSAHTDRPYRITAVGTVSAARPLFDPERFDCIILDYRLPDSDGLDLLRHAPTNKEDLPPVVVLTAFGSETLAVEALKAGANDYLAKSTDGGYLQVLPSIIERVIREHQLQQQWARRHHQQQLILESAGEGILSVACDGTIRCINPAAATMLGGEAETVLERPLDSVLCASDARGNDRNGLLLEPCFTGTPLRSIILWLRRQDGRRFPARCTITPMQEGHGIHGVAILFQDITQQQRTAKRLQLAANVLENITDAVVVTNPDGDITLVNPAFTEITGFPPAEVLGKKPSIMKSNHHDPAFYQQMWRALNSEGRWKGEVWNRTRDGEIFLAEECITAIPGPDGEAEYYVAVFQNVTETRQREAQMHHRAYHDILTNLPNRALFLDRLEQALSQADRHGHRVAVLFIDLDNFKAINDRWGHECGDRVLQQAAERMAQCIRVSDTVCRLGGDEFTILLAHLDEERDAARVADKLLKLLHNPFAACGTRFTLSASIGIALHPPHGAEPQGLISTADRAMYQAKQGGKDRYLFASVEGQERRH